MVPPPMRSSSGPRPGILSDLFLLVVAPASAQFLASAIATLFRHWRIQDLPPLAWAPLSDPSLGGLGVPAAQRAPLLRFFFGIPFDSSVFDLLCFGGFPPPLFVGLRKNVILFFFPLSGFPLLSAPVPPAPLNSPAYLVFLPATAGRKLESMSKPPNKQHPITDRSFPLTSLQYDSHCRSP